MYLVLFYIITILCKSKPIFMSLEYSNFKRKNKGFKCINIYVQTN